MDADIVTEPLAQAAVITGASSGIGRALAVALAPLTRRLLLLGRDVVALDGLARELGGQGAEVQAVMVNLDDGNDIRRAVDALPLDGVPVDLLVHSAGVHIPARWLESDEDAFDLQYRVNVRAPYLLTRLLLPGLIAAKGQVVFVNSTAGQNAAPGVGQYAATKHALKALADSLRAEVNPDGVRVLSVYPGRTATPMQALQFAREQRPFVPERLLQPEDVASAVLNALQLPRTAEVTDLMIRPFLKA